MSQLNANMPDGRMAEPPRSLGAEYLSFGLSRTPAAEADADMMIAREAVARVAESESEFAYAAFARRGSYDADAAVQSALLAIKLAKEPRA